MKRINWVVLLMVVFAFSLLAGCADRVYIASPQPDPPPWAPAYGVRTKCHYRYYPSASVYFDIDRKVYFYLWGGVWRVSTVLPPGIHITVYDFVVLELDTDKPYKHYREHRKNHPPGQMKKKEKGHEKEKEHH